MKPHNQSPGQNRPRDRHFFDLLELRGLTSGHRAALWAVIAIAGSMFVIETAAGHFCGSHALRADALDFLSDALLYGLSLSVLGKGIRARAGGAALKAGIMCLASAGVLGSALYHFEAPALPHAGIMGLFGALGIISNLACITILAPHTGERRVFRLYEDEKTGPDILGSSAVVVTSAAVWMLQSPWPDLLVAVLASAQLMWLAARTLRPALVAYQRND